MGVGGVVTGVLGGYELLGGRLATRESKARKLVLISSYPYSFIPFLMGSKLNIARIK